MFRCIRLIENGCDNKIKDQIKYPNIENLNSWINKNINNLNSFFHLVFSHLCPFCFSVWSFYFFSSFVFFICFIPVPFFFLLFFFLVLLFLISFYNLIFSFSFRLFSFLIVFSFLKGAAVRVFLVNLSCLLLQPLVFYLLFQWLSKKTVNIKRKTDGGNPKKKGHDESHSSSFSFVGFLSFLGSSSFSSSFTNQWKER